MTTSSTFDPQLHLSYSAPTSKISMKDLGLEGTAPSEIGVTSPFQLLSAEGVEMMRRDLFKDDVIKECLVYGALNGPHCQLRGVSKAAKFVKDFWSSPAVQAAVSQAAGVDLIPVFDYELGHTNIQVPKDQTREQYIKTLRDDPVPKSLTIPTNSRAEKVAVSTQSQGAEDDAPPVVGYHKDCYPWVVVVMLSDVSNMKGGETAIRRGDGSVVKAIGPNIGSCVVMQGGYINHCALPCSGSSERITMVTSFRQKNPNYRDISNLANVRDSSHWNELFHDWTQARLTLVQDKIEAYKQALEKKRAFLEGQSPGKLLREPTVELKEFENLIKDVSDHLVRASDEMLPYSSPINVWSTTPTTAQAHL